MHTMHTLADLTATYGIGGALLILAGAGMVAYGFIALTKVILFVSDTLFGPDSPDSSEWQDRP